MVRVEFGMAPVGTDLWLGSVHPTVDEKALGSAGGKFGNVRDVRIFRSTKCAHMSFERAEVAKEAAFGLRGRILGVHNSWRLKVDFWEHCTGDRGQKGAGGAGERDRERERGAPWNTAPPGGGRGGGGGGGGGEGGPGYARRGESPPGLREMEVERDRYRFTQRARESGGGMGGYGSPARADGMGGGRGLEGEWVERDRDCPRARHPDGVCEDVRVSVCVCGCVGAFVRELVCV